MCGAVILLITCVLEVEALYSCLQLVSIYVLDVILDLRKVTTVAKELEHWLLFSLSQGYLWLWTGFN
jgi:hypothetical protein